MNETPDTRPLKEAIEAWIERVKAEGHYANATLRTWTPCLRGFYRWQEASAPEADTLQRLSAPLLRRYAAALKNPRGRGGKGLRPRSLRNHFSALRAFCADAVARGLLVANVALELPMPTLDAPQRPTLSKDQVAALLQATNKLTPARKRLFGSALLQVLCCTGIRHRSLLDLDMDDITLSTSDKGNLVGKVRVRHAKGNKFYSVFLPPPAALAVQAWLIERGRMKVRHTGLWAITVTRKAGDATLTDLLASLKRIAGLDESACVLPHVLRRAAATNMLRNGLDLKTISRNLGHADILTTAQYLFTDEETQRTGVEAQSWEEAANPPQPPAAPVTQPARGQSVAPGKQPATQASVRQMSRSRMVQRLRQ